MKKAKIINCKFIGTEMVRDLEVDHPLHRFYANGIVVSNSHAISYGLYSGVELWLKAYYPLEFMCANLSITGRSQEKKGVSLLDQRVKYCQSLGFKVLPPDVRYAGDMWIIHDGGLMAPLTNLKGFGSNDFDTVVKNRPYSSLSEFCEKTRLGRSKVETLILGGALDCFGEREYMYNWHSEVFLCKSKKKKKAQASFFDDDEMEDQFEIKQQFSKEDLETAFFDLNGFRIEENLLLKYAKWLNENKEVKTIDQVKSGKTAKHIYMFCKISRIDQFTSRSGKELIKLTLSDGVCSTDTVMQSVNYKRFKRTLGLGNILAIPIQISDDNNFYLEDLGRKNAIIIESK